jgi:hypothetical protein
VASLAASWVGAPPPMVTPHLLAVIVAIVYYVNLIQVLSGEK